MEFICKFRIEIKKLPVDPVSSTWVNFIKKLPITLRGQTVRFENCKQIIPQQAKVGFVAEFATLLFFFDLLCCFGFHRQIAKTLFLLKIAPKTVNFAEAATKCVETGNFKRIPQTVGGIRKL